MKLTQKITREYLRIIGLKLRRNVEFNEYVLVDSADNTYYSDSLDDIIGTARIMHGGHEHIEDAEQYLADLDVYIAAPRHEN